MYVYRNNPFSLWTKSYDVTIQMKALCLYFHMILFISQSFERMKFGRNLFEIVWKVTTAVGVAQRSTGSGSSEAT